VFLEKAKQLLDEHGFADLWLKYYYLTENYDKATAMELEDSKQTAWNLFMLGFSYAKRNKGSQAIYYLEQSANKSPVNPLINKELLKSYRKFNKLNKGEVLAEELVVLYALDAEVFNESAKILALKGELKRALVNANRAYELDGSQLDVWETLMNIHLRLGNKKSSEKWAAMILAEDSNHPAKSLFN
jgi:tetratricopeptide (TPR) repeat protein